MSKRFGRNQKRKLKQSLEDAEKSLTKSLYELRNNDHKINELQARIKSLTPEIWCSKECFPYGMELMLNGRLGSENIKMRIPKQVIQDRQTISFIDTLAGEAVDLFYKEMRLQIHHAVDRFLRSSRNDRS